MDRVATNEEDVAQEIGGHPWDTDVEMRRGRVKGSKLAAARVFPATFIGFA